MKAYIFFAAMLLGLMPSAVEAQGTAINSRDLRGAVVYQAMMATHAHGDHVGGVGPTVSNGNNGGNDMMVDDKGVRINFSSRSGMK